MGCHEAGASPESAPPLAAGGKTGVQAVTAESLQPMAPKALHFVQQEASAATTLCMYCAADGGEMASAFVIWRFNLILLACVKMPGRDF